MPRIDSRRFASGVSAACNLRHGIDYETALKNQGGGHGGWHHRKRRLEGGRRRQMGRQSSRQDLLVVARLEPWPLRDKEPVSIYLDQLVKELAFMRRHLILVHESPIAPV